jgi:hypothetical protein
MVLDIKVCPIAFCPSILSISNWTSIIAKEFLVGEQVSGPWISMSTGSSRPGGIVNTWMARGWGEMTDAMDRNDAKALLAGALNAPPKVVASNDRQYIYNILTNMEILVHSTYITKLHKHCLCLLRINRDNFSQDVKDLIAD